MRACWSSSQPRSVSAVPACPPRPEPPCQQPGHTHVQDRMFAELGCEQGTAHRRCGGLFVTGSAKTARPANSGAVLVLKGRDRDRPPAAADACPRRERRCIKIRSGRSRVGPFEGGQQRDARLITARRAAVICVVADPAPVGPVRAEPADLSRRASQDGGRRWKGSARMDRCRFRLGRLPRRPPGSCPRQVAPAAAGRAQLAGWNRAVKPNRPRCCPEPSWRISRRTSHPFPKTRRWRSAKPRPSPATGSARPPTARRGRGATMDNDKVVEYALGEVQRLVALRAQPGAQAPQSPPGPARPSRRE